MTKTVIWGTVFAAVFVISMVAVIPLADAAGHLAITSKATKNTGAVSKVTFTTSVNIPQDGSAGAFGFAALGNSAILAITTHGGVGPDSPVQANQADPVFHTHVITLNFASGACASGVEVASITFAEAGQLKVKGNTVKVTAIPQSQTGGLTGALASFNLSVIGPLNNPTNVCVDNLTIFP